MQADDDDVMAAAVVVVGIMAEVNVGEDVEDDAVAVLEEGRVVLVVVDDVAGVADGYADAVILNYWMFLP